MWWVDDTEIWRRGQDSNLRAGEPTICFPSSALRPLEAPLQRNLSTKSQGTEYNAGAGFSPTSVWHDLAKGSLSLLG